MTHEYIIAWKQAKALEMAQGWINVALDILLLIALVVLIMAYVEYLELEDMK